MSNEITFDRDFGAVPGRAEQVAPGVRRILAPNPGPFTFTGTCTYLIGEGTVAVVDPGPEDPEHTAAILAALKGEVIAQIIATHTHKDHTGGVPALQKASGVKTYGEGPHRPARPLFEGETERMEAGGDLDFSPDVLIRDGDVIEGPGYALEAVAMPGHTANHLAFALRGTSILFSGDHVMAWSTSIVAPPDGSMGDYLASLQKLRDRREDLYFPGHGPPAANAHSLVERYIAHRNAREAAIMRRLERGESDIPTLVQSIYIGLDPRLVGAASLTTLAHLEHLVAQNKVATDGAPSRSGRYRLA